MTHNNDRCYHAALWRALSAHAERGDADAGGASSVSTAPPINVVAIVGAAHVPGIAREWSKLQDEVPAAMVEPIDWMNINVRSSL